VHHGKQAAAQPGTEGMRAAAKAAATAASTALPPRSSTARPTGAAGLTEVTTMPSRPQVGSKDAAKTAACESEARMTMARTNLKSGILQGQSQEFLHQLIMGFRVLRVFRDAFHGTDLDTLRRVEMADALGAFHRVDDVIVDALRDCLVGAFRFADVAVDALFGDLERQWVTSTPGSDAA
jgi:hypothetical protein